MTWYDWVKAVHVMAVISWMAGVLYLPRLFVYHCQAAPGSETSELFKVMERRLMHAITIPAATVSWIMGLVMVGHLGLTGHGGWLHAKLALVVLLTACTWYLERCRLTFRADANQRPAKFYRILNEVPTLLMIGIVILVIVKPF